MKKKCLAFQVDVTYNMKLKYKETTQNKNKYSIKEKTKEILVFLLIIQVLKKGKYLKISSKQIGK